MTEAEKLRNRILRLRQYTTGRGCSEAEAMAFAAKAAELMREHGISEEDLVVDQRSVRRKTNGHSLRDALWRKLAHFTNTASLLNEEKGRPVRTFLGHEPGPEVATYLYIVLDRAIDRAVADFKAGTYYKRRRTLVTKRKAVAEFTLVMCARLSARLRELFAESISPAARTAALAVRDQRYPANQVVTTRRQKPGKVTAASIDGFLAGNAVALSHGVKKADAPCQIGGAK